MPMISVGWGRCDPSNPKNRRRRPSILVEEGDKTILVDTGPDLRVQLLDAQVRKLDAVLYTHAHADHLHGIDDLREVNRAMGGPIDVYATTETLAEIDQRFSYVFKPLDSSVNSIYKPWLVPHPIDGAFSAAGVDVIPVIQDHGFSETIGFRFGRVAYSTDVVNLSEEALESLRGLDLWIVGCLIDAPHPTHAHVGKAVEWAERIKPKRTVITHMSPRLDFDVLSASLPEGIEPGFDGQVIEIP